MSSYKLARRAFLRACGGSAALTLPLLRSIEARAQGMPAPRRLLIIHHSQGSPLEQWRPAGGATTQAFTLPANSAPFAPLQSKMILIDGLNLVTASMATDNGGQNTSEGGMVALMTGVPTLGRIGQQDHCAGGPSIDQLLLQRSPLLGGEAAPSRDRTRFGSLQLAADIRAERDEVAPRVMSYLKPTASVDPSMARTPLFPETQPLNAFTRLFGGGLPSSSDAATMLARDLSVLDFARSDLKRLRGLVPSNERARLDSHADAIQQVEATVRQNLSAISPVCTLPAQPPMFPEAASQVGHGPAVSVGRLAGVDYYDPADPNNHPHQVLGQTHLALIKAAFLCDLTRVATFSWSSATSQVLFPASMGGATLQSVASPVPHYEPLSSNTPDALAWWAAIDLFYAQQSSMAIQSLAAAADIDGNSLLDNTVVVYVTAESRRWDHMQKNVPLAVFGGRNTGLRGGTFLEITGGPLPSLNSSAASNRPFNDFWLALASAFGVDLGTLGAPTQYTGPLAGVFG